MNDKVSSEEINILIVAGVYPPEHGGGGLRVHRTYKRIADTVNLKISVITISKPQHTEEFREYDGVRIYRIKPRRSALIQFIMVGKIMLKYNLHRCMLMHGIGSSMIVVLASLWAKLFSMKLIREVTVYNSEPKNSLKKKIRMYLNFVRYYLPLRFSYSKADMLVALNESINSYYQRLGIPEQRIWKRPNPVDTSMYYYPDENERIEARNNLGLNKESIVCLLVGQFEPRKNQRFAVQLLNQLPPDYVLILAGPVPSTDTGYLDRVASDIDDNKLNDRVFLFPGYHAILKDFFHAADVLLIPSFSEGTPNVMLEALCCGIPVIVNENLQLYEYIKNGENGCNTMLTVDAFSHDINIMIRKAHDGTYRRAISNNAKNLYGHSIIDNQFKDHLRTLSLI